MGKFKFEIKPAIKPEERHKIAKLLEEMGYDVLGSGQCIDDLSCDISFTNFKPWQARVIKERDELQERIDKLEIFMTTQVYADLKPQEQVLLDEQLQAMYAYRLPLMDRILLF